jgi:hypothetical protein
MTKHFREIEQTGSFKNISYLRCSVRVISSRSASGSRLLSRYETYALIYSIDVYDLWRTF